MPAKGSGKIEVAREFIKKHPNATIDEVGDYLDGRGLKPPSRAALLSMFYRARSEVHSDNGKSTNEWSIAAREAAGRARATIPVSLPKKASVTTLAYCPCCGLDLKVIQTALRLARKMKGEVPDEA
jgi:hypothetical protein